MKSIKRLFVFALLSVGLNACFENPKYPVVPQIEILNDELYFGKSTSEGSDSIVVALRFKDGDGDIGIDDSFKDPTFSLEKFYFLYDANEPNILRYTTFEKSNVNYQFKKNNPQFDLPEFTPPFSCSNWQVKRNVSNQPLDTIYTEFNSDFNNVIIEYLIKQTDGTFKKYDIDEVFLYPDCGDRTLGGGRIPNLSKNVGNPTPLDGKIVWSIKSFGFDAIFSIKVLKLRIYIKDRALHKSNIVESKEFTLQSIRK
jgi:hypothetical protein